MLKGGGEGQGGLPGRPVYEVRKCVFMRGMSQVSVRMAEVVGMARMVGRRGKEARTMRWNMVVERWVGLDGLKMEKLVVEEYVPDGDADIRLSHLTARSMTSYGAVCSICNVTG